VPKQIYFWLALSWSGLILFACLLPSNDIPQVKIPYLDKVTHSFFYFIFLSLWFLFFKKKLNSSNNFKPLAISFVFSVFFGIGIELMQQFFTHTRTADILDVFANIFGATLAVIAIVLLNTHSGLGDRI
jgi:VanZ family protein